MPETAPPDPLEPLRRVARRVPGAMALGRWLHRRIDPELRAVERLRRQEAALLQPFPDTFNDRYPEVFTAVAERLAGLSRPRVLSFGCSDGAELRALRRHLPHAELVGIDLNPRAVAKARAMAAGDPLTRVVLAGDSAGEPRESFDAILAMAVLRHGELEADRPADCSAILPFARAAAALEDLDARLRPGGWLAVWHAHFRVRDALPGYAAETLPFSERDPLDLLYGPDNRRRDGETSAEVLFRKPL